MAPPRLLTHDEVVAELSGSEGGGLDDVPPTRREPGDAGVVSGLWEPVPRRVRHRLADLWNV